MKILGNPSKEDMCGFVTTTAYKQLECENAKLRKLCEDLIRLPAVPSFDCYGCIYDEWKDCGGILREDCQLIKEATKLGIKVGN